MAASAGLLVSVRSAAEAAIALAGGAAIVDVKEPARGPLGRADDPIVADVIHRVAGQVPVSAALGELRDASALHLPAGLSFVKLGLAGYGKRDWRGRLRELLDSGSGPGCRPQLVVAAYADWKEADAPPLGEVCAFARSRPGNLLLIDTFTKGTGSNRRTLLDWLPVGNIVRLCRDCRAARVRVALAGSLGLEEIAALRGARPDWFGVRGAACARHDRQAGISLENVRALAAAVRPSVRGRVSSA